MDDEVGWGEVRRGRAGIGGGGRAEFRSPFRFQCRSVWGGWVPPFTCGHACMPTTTPPTAYA